MCFAFPSIRYEAFLLEYHGYLITACYDQENQRHFRRDDVDTEFRAFAETDKNGALLYPVEGVCGLLPLSSYVAGRELTCAVCTK